MPSSRRIGSRQRCLGWFRAARRYKFPVVQAAEALVPVGRGVSYTELADRLRVRSSRGRFANGAQLVANWVEVLAPAVAAESAETAWPETVVCDSTWFMVKNTRTGTTSLAFHVLAAFGYDAGAAKSRVLKLSASPRGSQTDSEALMRSVPGAPVMLVSDDHDPGRNAAAAVWPATFRKLCEHHLHASVVTNLGTYGRAKYGDPLMELLNEAFTTPQAWEAFKTAAVGVTTQAWITSHDADITDQVAQRSTLPAHHSTGAIEPVIAAVREFMEPRAFCYRNAERTNRMLELVRLRFNRCDDPLRYATAIRTHLETTGGQFSRQGVVRNPLGSYSLRL